MGWDERALHDAVSVYALFNFMNRLVEGLGIQATADYFDASARGIAGRGYAGLRAMLCERRLSAWPGSSRAATDALLTGLREGRWRPRAWVRFLASAMRRSVEQARLRPRALAEITLLHLAFAALGGPERRVWTATSWGLAATHLGMLEGSRSVGCAGVLTLTRANLPALTRTRRLPPMLPLLALSSDIADGRLARALGTTSPFGAAADSLSDAAFWSWFVRRYEPSGPLAVAALLAWAFPIVVVTTTSVRRGHMVDAPRPALLRPAAVLQAVLTVRALVRLRRTPREGSTG